MHAIWGGFLDPISNKNLPPSEFSPYKNTGNVSTVFHAGKLLALCEGHKPYLLSWEDLETIKPYTFSNQLSHPFCAHPKVDAITGELMFFGYSAFQKPYLKYSVISASGEISHTVAVDLPHPVAVHDFAITENYTVLMDLPITLKKPTDVDGSWHEFRKDLSSRFGIIPRYGNNDEIQTIEFPALYVPHTLNAYEQGDEVVVIATRVDSMG